jgi:hypothetical protein
MQFGRIHGIALIILGVILIGLQLNLAFANRSQVPEPGQPSAASVPPHDSNRFGPLAGIIGAASLVAGIAVLATARRRDEPDSAHRVR